ncbi:hypothetical protein NQ176_g2752 [Zarea fungicola]|uniref:Uncharacterized protein n=1 Tax=Zarea fungicola TaxID=93591 RepID=A0ACC1NMW7_9HYPO|nr:hypothetical protein NQ176_g2752 [Lecanicillium fungicola]
MAAFFPRTIYNTEASIVPLFRLLDDFEPSSRQCRRASNVQFKKQQYYRKPAVSHWKPRFDVRETAETYELHGELPGLNKGDVSIEFTEPQTLVIRGKVDRTYTVGTSPYGTPASDEVTQQQQRTPADESASSHLHQATVADEDSASIQEENGFEVVSEASNTAAATPETEAAAVATPTALADKSKYWLSERSIGEFERSFSFPTRVDQDTVTASFQDGILSITVPKAKKHEIIRISIN